MSLPADGTSGFRCVQYSCAGTGRPGAPVVLAGPVLMVAVRPPVEASVVVRPAKEKPVAAVVPVMTFL